MNVRLPTVAQMKVRSLSGHRAALSAIAHGEAVLRPEASLGEVRGMRKVLGTLSRWECIDLVDGVMKLTARGEDLRSALGAA